MKRKKLWKGTLSELIDLARKNKDVTEKLGTNAPKRGYVAIVEHDVEETETLTGEKINVYPYFQKKIYGQEIGLDELMNFLKGLAASGPKNRPFGIMVGPPGSGKSTIAEKSRKTYYGLTAYRIKDCPWSENPLKAIPKNERKKIAKELGFSRAPLGDLCAHCLKHYNGDNGENIDWKNLPIEEWQFSRSQGTAIIGTVEEAVNVDISKLIGSISTPKLTRFEESDPDSWDTKKGAIFRANNGPLEFREMLKHAGEFHEALSEICQEAEMEIPGIDNFTGLDVLIIGHTNIDEYKKFLSTKGREWLRDRAKVIEIPYVLNYKEEARIYEKLLSETNFKNIHLSPRLLEQISQLPVASRLIQDDKIESTFQKVKWYANEKDETFEDIDISLQDLVKAGQNFEDMEKKEGMFGISPRTIWSVLRTISLPKAKDCLFVLDFLDDLEKFLTSGADPTKQDRPQEVNERIPTLVSDLREVIIEEIHRMVTKSAIGEYEEEMQNIFINYLEGAKETRKKKETGEEVDEETEARMRKIEEELIPPISEGKKNEYRFGQLAKKGELPTKEQHNLENYPDLEQAIEQVLLERIEPLLDFILLDESIDNRTKRAKKRTELLQRLHDKGYCDVCTKKALKIARNKRREES
ncbi:hypothetical protein MYX06_01685 [Patescibacteria group bacterium AH-259-L05]|nr:hypothetical protein [Patescibacteria group bacterium AH-259-L05]